MEPVASLSDQDCARDYTLTLKCDNNIVLEIIQNHQL